jgi:IS30 family transposase
MIALLTSHQDKVLTITSDNGKEIAGHEAIIQALDTPAY